MAAMLGFGTIPIFLRHFADVLDPWTVNGIRYSVGAVFWLPFVLLLQRRSDLTAAVRRRQQVTARRCGR